MCAWFVFLIIPIFFLGVLCYNFTSSRGTNVPEGAWVNDRTGGLKYRRF